MAKLTVEERQARAKRQAHDLAFSEIRSILGKVQIEMISREKGLSRIYDALEELQTNLKAKAL